MQDHHQQHGHARRFRWSINPYRGCQHACVYCFARGTHEYLGYDAGRDFESRIVVKTNAARGPAPAAEQAELEARADRPRHRLRPVPAGRDEVRHHARDPRGHARIPQPVHMLTKSPSVLRDLDLWSRLAEVTDAQIAFSVPTLDEAVWKKMEPGTAGPIKRLEAIRELTAAGVPCGVMIAPIIPGLTDDEAHLEDVIRPAKEHGARFVAPNVLNLKPGSKEWFMPALREAYPHLTPEIREVLPRRLRAEGVHAAGARQSQRATREVRLQRAGARAGAAARAGGAASDGDLT